MNKEQIIDEAYEKYLNYPLATIHDHHTNVLYKNIYKGWCIRNGRSIVSPHPTRHLTKEEFIDKCKTDTEFSERWGLKIEERELSLEERIILAGYDYENRGGIGWNMLKETVDMDNSIPRKLITITYNNETIESYE